MLKYTLGALAASVILLGTAFVVLAQVTDGGANQGRAPLILVSVNGEIAWPQEIWVTRGQIVELSLQNHSLTRRGLRLAGDGVEQLPELPGHESHAHVHTYTRDPLPYIEIDAPPQQADGALVRFNEEGRYTLMINYPGVYFPSVPVSVIVE